MLKLSGYRSGALIAALSLAACSSGSDAPPPAFNATGHWMTWLTDPITMEEIGPFGNYVLATGGLLDGVGLTGTVSGNNLYMTVDIGIGLMIFTGVMSGNEVAGTVLFPGLPVPANFRMQQFAPTGTLTANGTVGGTTVAVNSTVAFTERYYSDIALTTLTDVNVIDDDGVTRFELNFEQPGALTVGTIDASVVPISVVAGNDIGRNTIVAASGTVTVTQYDASGFAATYNLTLVGGETVTGGFDVVFDLDAYDP